MVALAWGWYAVPRACSSAEILHGAREKLLRASKGIARREREREPRAALRDGGKGHAVGEVARASGDQELASTRKLSAERNGD